MNKKGFTLIELLVVIAIIGLLSSIVLVSLNRARAKARDTRRMADLKQIQLAVEMYYDDNGSYPLSCQGSGLYGGHCPSYGDCDTDYIVGSLSGYIAQLPIDPKYDTTNQCYLYRSDTVDYKILAHHTMELDCPPIASDHPMYDPVRSATQCTIAVFSTGGRDW